ncbi:MAG: hypothetical protein ACE5NC_04900 [Anaerolineae bacterium]
MERKILALMENSIGPKLLLSTRLKALGYAVTVVSAPDRFRKRIESEAFDWLILDEAAWRLDRAHLLEQLARLRGTARIVWLGQPPRGARIPTEAVFDKPLDYDEIVRFFSVGASADPGFASGPSRGAGTRPRPDGGLEGTPAPVRRSGERCSTQAAPASRKRGRR